MGAAPAAALANVAFAGITPADAIADRVADELAALS